MKTDKKPLGSAADKNIPNGHAVANGKDNAIRKAEGMATFGMLLLAVALAAPFASLQNTAMLANCKWLYAAGALIFTIARCISVGNNHNGSLRVRRMRRMSAWAGVAFCMGAFFWFYNETRIQVIPGYGALAILRNTIMFSLVGALLQLISTWMVAYREKKEQQR